MFNLKAIITTLALGSSSVAMAAPSVSYGHAPASQTSWRERGVELRGRTFDDRTRFDQRDRRFRNDRYDRSDRYDRDDFGPRRYRSAWVALSEPLELTRGRDAIDVNLRGTFTQLRFQAATGRTHIDRVIVQFVDGSRQVVRPNRILDTRDRMFEVQLDGNNRRVDRIIVTGDANRRGQIQVFGI